MDTTSLKHSKHSKKTKSGDKGNSDVLVVPPDILKKLGISIGATNSAQQVLHNVNIGQTKPSTENGNIETTNILPTNFDNKPNDSSILETANLMKKSVFLSPTFIPTVANVIPGEFEISNSKNIDDSLLMKNVNLEQKQVINICSESMTIPEPCKEGSEIKPSHLNQHLQINGIFTTLPESLVLREQVEGAVVKDSHKNKSHSIDKSTSKKITTENDNVQLLENEKDCKEIDTGGSAVSFVSSEISQNIVKNNISLTESNQVNQDMGNNTISLGSPIIVSAIQVNKDIITKSNIIFKEDAIEENQDVSDCNISLIADAIQLNQDEGGKTICFKEDIKGANQLIQDVTTNNKNEAVLIEQAKPGNYHISLDEIQIHNGELDKDSIFLQEIEIEPAVFNDNSISLEEIADSDNIMLDNNAIQIEEDKDLITLDDIIVTETVNNNVFFEDQNYLIELEDNSKQRSSNIEMDSDQKVSGMFTPYSDINSQFCQIISQIEESKIEQCETSQKETVSQIVESKVVQEENSQSANNSINNTYNKGKANSGIVAPVNNKNQEVNIISKEIVPPLDGKEIRPESPLIRPLASVPLNTVVAPRKMNDIGSSEIMFVDKESPTELPIITESESSINMVSSHSQEVDSTCVQNNHTVQSINSDGTCEKASLIKKNNIDVLPASESGDKLSMGNQIDNEEITSSSIWNGQCIDNELKPKNNHSEIPFERNSSGEIIDKDIIKINHEYKSDKIQTLNSVDAVEKKKRKKKKTIEQNMNEDKGFCDDELNNILKSSKENSDANTHVDKVKEIAEYIKKFSHIYKDKKGINKEVKKLSDKKKEINKVLDKKRGNNKVSDIKKDTIDTKSNLTKSKLCIQGVEKPGGNRGGDSVTKVLKTYNRQPKRQNINVSTNISDKIKTISNSLIGASDTELCVVNNTTASKMQQFCLCYDFGRLGIISDNNPYEHVHFWRHYNNSDLETIMSIYNDDDAIHTDRTEVNDIKLTEITEDDINGSSICWYDIWNDQPESYKDFETLNENRSIDESVQDGSDKVDGGGTHQLKEINDIFQSLSEDEHGKTSLPLTVDCEDKSDKSMNTLKDNDVNLDDDSDISYDIITIVEMEDEQNDENIRNLSTDTDPKPRTDKDISEGADGKESINQTQEVHNDGSSSVNNNQVSMTFDNTQGNKNSESTKTKSTDIKVEKEISNTQNNLTEKIFESDPSQNNPKRRKRGRPRLHSKNVSIEEPSSKKQIKCGVCSQLLSDNEWERHVTHVHHYIAWKAGTTFDFHDPDLSKKLLQRLQTVGSLKCYNCGMQTKKLPKYINHIKFCMQKDVGSKRASSSKNDVIKCGVCLKNVPYTSWAEHMGKEHDYLAWIYGQNALDIEDEAAVSKHLLSIVRAIGDLVCNKCGLKRKRVKLYLEHIQSCDGTTVDMDYSADHDLTTSLLEDDESIVDKKTITCGVCKQEVKFSHWIEHIGREHNYLAWKDGSPPLDTNDEEAVWNHLQEFIRQNDGLICYKCGLNRKRVKLYLLHIETCNGEGVNPDDTADKNVTIDQESADEKEYQCEVCGKTISVSDWNEHIGREHNYLAWKVGHPPLDVNDEDAVKEHLLHIIRSCEGLICYKCGLNRRRVKLYLAHIKTCDGSTDADESTNLNSGSQTKRTIDRSEKTLKCGVCDQDVPLQMWINHIGSEHAYLAWQKDAVPLDLEDEDAVKAHLNNISRQYNGLICSKCNIVKKYPKSFQHHIKECTGPSSLDDSKLKNELEISSFDIDDVTTETVKCGVCKKEVKTSQWLNHIETEHEYMAWLDGRPPVDLEDPAMIQRHLTEVSRKLGGLTCKKCGILRKYAKSYVHHIETCGEDVDRICMSAALSGKDAVECAVCAAKVNPRDWNDHAMRNHYNVAWIVGTTPIEINNPYGVEPYIKEYQHKHNNKLVCKTCGIHRVSAVGFYAHIITCGKTEEEQEIYKSLCEICNNKYLRIYKSQHMTMHREKEYAMERKLLIAKEKQLKKEEDEPVEIVGGRRKAAEKAKTVIEKYTSNIIDGSHCSKCGFSSEIEAEMANHVCVERRSDGSDSDGSVELDQSSEEEEDSDFDSNISDEEREAREQEMSKSKRHGDSSASKIQRLPFQIKNINAYMRKSAEEFVALHLTDQDIYSEWRNLEYEVVSEVETPKYLPPLEESCKVRHTDGDTWMSLKRFESQITNDVITLFTGACIQSISWVPPYVNESAQPGREYISVVTHLDTDVPRHFWYDKPLSSPGLIQIWDCGDMISGLPKFVMGLALDCGTIWSTDWCPSGTRDLIDLDEQTKDTIKPHRLGLLAVASASGGAYIFAIPDPSTIQEKDQIFCKLKPAVELRLVMDTNRKVHQATAIKWSKQKGHAHIVVGYADGTIAYFDLRNESPLLKSTENGFTIFYPYHDERTQNMCIEDVDIFPARKSDGGAGVVAAGSVGGAGVGTLQSHAAAAQVVFPPHWPAALLAGDDNLVIQAINEVEWYGAGRRVGGMRTCSGCVWCGRVAAAAAPTIRVMRTHPAYCDLHRQVIATIQMIPFSGKRKRKNDELSMIMEPFTYSDAVVKYGIDFRPVTVKDKNSQQKLAGLPRETYPERFPLSDVTSMRFCPSSRNHHKLAVATHAGLLFIINV